MIKKTADLGRFLNDAKLAARRIYGKYNVQISRSWDIEFFVISPAVKHNGGIVWIVFIHEPNYMTYCNVMKAYRHTAKTLTLCANYKSFQKSMWSDK